VILPKLFRRLVDYFALNDDDPSLAGFPDYLAQRNDRVFILTTGHYTGFDYVVEVEKQVVRLTTAPENLVFQELERSDAALERGRVDRAAARVEAEDHHPPIVLLARDEVLDRRALLAAVAAVDDAHPVHGWDA
jgi:hypothetical protein